MTEDTYTLECMTRVCSFCLLLSRTWSRSLRSPTCVHAFFLVCVWGGGGGGGRERGIGGHNVAVSTLCSRINLLCLPLVPDLRRCAPCGVFFVIIMLRIRL